MSAAVSKVTFKITLTSDPKVKTFINSSILILINVFVMIGRLIVGISIVLYTYILKLLLLALHNISILC